MENPFIGLVKISQVNYSFEDLHIYIFLPALLAISGTTLDNFS